MYKFQFYILLDLGLIYSKEYLSPYDIYLNNFVVETNNEQINYRINAKSNNKEIISLEKNI